MGILDWLRGDGTEKARSAADTDTVRRIAGELDELDPDRARYVACFAYVLGRVARADLHVSREETRAMEEIIVERTGLPREQAVLVVQMAKTHNELFGGTENFVVTRELAAITDADEHRTLLDCLYAVSACDHSITAEEDHEIRRIARELRLDHGDFIAAREPYAEHLEVLKED